MALQRSHGFILGIVLFISTGISAAPSAYSRARGLADDDPLEAEALYVRFLRADGNEKLQRAAAYELFFLRLRNGRLAEAFRQTTSPQLRKQFKAKAAEALGIGEDESAKLIGMLRQYCAGADNDAKIADFLQQRKATVPVYDFALRVAEHCRKGDADFMPELPVAGQEWSKRAVHLGLLQVRGLLSRLDNEAALSLILRMKTEAAALLEKDTRLSAQVSLAEARQLIRKGDFDEALALCEELERKKTPARAVSACRFLSAYALMKKGDYAGAYGKVSKEEIHPAEIDNRLLRLTAAVAAGKTGPAKLRKFMRRASYGDCAALLRDLAREIAAPE